MEGLCVAYVITAWPQRHLKNINMITDITDTFVQAKMLQIEKLMNEAFQN